MRQFRKLAAVICGVPLLLALAAVVPACSDDDDSSSGDVCSQACAKLASCSLCVSVDGSCISQSECARGCQQQGWQQEAQCGLEVDGCDQGAIESCIGGTQPYSAGASQSPATLERVRYQLASQSSGEIAFHYGDLGVGDEALSLDVRAEQRGEAERALIQVFAIHGEPMLRSGDTVVALDRSRHYRLRLERRSGSDWDFWVLDEGGARIAAGTASITHGVVVRHSPRISLR